VSEVADVLAARGPEVGERLARIEARLREIAAAGRPPIDRLAGDTIAASACARCSSCSPPGRAAASPPTTPG
jgi:hypothetical protein